MGRSAIFGFRCILGVLMVPAACRPKAPVSTPTATATYFSGTAFACTGVSDFPANGLMLGVTEASPVLAGTGKDFTCTDQWSALDFDHPPWGSDHFLAKQSRSEVTNKILPRVKQGFRQTNGHWEYNQPDCTKTMRDHGVCGLRVMVQAKSMNNQASQSQNPIGVPIEAQIYDACPENHWNNALKDLPEHPDNNGVGNPCRKGSAHYDLNDKLWQAIGLPKSSNGIEVDVSFPGKTVQQLQTASSAATNKQDSTSTAANGGASKFTDASGKTYPYCTNGSNTGGGFGWQPDLGGPNGGSCRVPEGAKVYTDPSGTSFPYCTNGSNTGGGFGWQPELGGPNGGSCRVP